MLRGETQVGLEGMPPESEALRQSIFTVLSLECQAKAEILSKNLRL